MRFTRKTLELFAELSRDTNPLHTDDRYARRTPYGEVVVYGVAALLKALGFWAKGRRFHIVEIKTEFRNPLFLERDYELAVTERDHDVVLKILDGRTLCVLAHLTWDEWRGGATAEDGPLATLKRHFDLDAGQLPSHELKALLWASYYTGMVSPGRQALFSGLEFKFDREVKACREFEALDVQKNLEPRFNEQRITASVTGARSAVLTAFVRPDSPRYEIADIERRLGASSELAGKTAFVTGASRGFGAVLAKAFALKGAHVLINSRESATDVYDEITSRGGRCDFLPADLNEFNDCQAMQRQALKLIDALDILVLNAAPLLSIRKLPEQSKAEREHAEELSLRYVTNPMRTVGTLLKPRAMVVGISSILTRNSGGAVSAYSVGKLALENHLRALALEMPDKNFVIARPPRMLTDRTNLPYQIEEIVSPITIAAKLMATLATLPSDRNFHELCEAQGPNSNA